MLGNIELLHRLTPAQRTPDAAACPRVTWLQFRFPLVQQASDAAVSPTSSPKIVGDAAVGVDVEEVLMQLFRQKPGDAPRNFRNASAPAAQQYCWASASDGAARGMAYSAGKACPAGGSQYAALAVERGRIVAVIDILIRSYRSPGARPKSIIHLRGHVSSAIRKLHYQCPGMMAVLMSPLRFSMCRSTCCSRESGASPVM